MHYSEALRAPIDGLPPITDGEAEVFIKKAAQAVQEKYGDKLKPRRGEDPAALQALAGAIELQEFRTSVAARQIGNSAAAFFHERDVVLPAEEAFASRYGLTAEDLDRAWNERRDGIRGRIFREEKERKAQLRDDFFALVDQIGVEQMGEGYDYGAFVARQSPEDLLQDVQARLDAQRSIDVAD